MRTQGFRNARELLQAMMLRSEEVGNARKLKASQVVVPPFNVGTRTDVLPPTGACCICVCLSAHQTNTHPWYRYRSGEFNVFVSANHVPNAISTCPESFDLQAVALAVADQTTSIYNWTLLRCLTTTVAARVFTSCQLMRYQIQRLRTFRERGRHSMPHSVCAIRYVCVPCGRLRCCRCCQSEYFHDKNHTLARAESQVDLPKMIVKMKALGVVEPDTDT